MYTDMMTIDTRKDVIFMVGLVAVNLQETNGCGCMDRG